MSKCWSKPASWRSSFREFYAEKDFEKCDRLLSLAENRATWLAGDKGPKPGPLKDPEASERLQVRGFVSAVDGSAQPVGLINCTEQRPFRCEEDTDVCVVAWSR